MGEEPRWGRGLIIKQLGDLFSNIHIVLVALSAGRGCFQKAEAMPGNRRRKFKAWRGDGDASAGTPAAAGPLELQGDAAALGELGKRRRSPRSLPGEWKGQSVREKVRLLCCCIPGCILFFLHL